MPEDLYKWSEEDFTEITVSYTTQNEIKAYVYVL
jgi:hypothetical protein